MLRGWKGDGGGETKGGRNRAALGIYVSRIKTCFPFNVLSVASKKVVDELGKLRAKPVEATLEQ